MIVSKSSWHYRLYTWIQKDVLFGDKANTNPDLCSYISTLTAGLVAALLTYAIYLTIEAIEKTAKGIGWIISRPFKLLGWLLFGGERRKQASCYALLGVFCLFAFSLFCMIVTMMLGIILGMPGTGGTLAYLFPRVVLSLIAFAVLIYGIVLLVRKDKQCETPFVTLVTTGIKDKWNGTFCRTITLVD
jgi:hypothetical protein